MLSTGQYLRDNPTTESKQAIMSGKLVTDSTMVKIVLEMINKLGPKPEFVLDGFPRTLPQSQWLADQHQGGNISVHAVIHLVISKEAAKARLVLRARSDDHEEAINKRFGEYDKNIEKILSVFKNHQLPIKDVDADDSIENIHNHIVGTVKSLKNSKTASDKH